MKQIQISLPIIHELNKKGERLCSPYLEKVSNGFIVKWSYQATSQAIQGTWRKYRVWYSFEDYDFNKAMKDLTDKIQFEYRECL